MNVNSACDEDDQGQNESDGKENARAFPYADAEQACNKENRRIEQPEEQTGVDETGGSSDGPVPLRSAVFKYSSDSRYFASRSFCNSVVLSGAYCARFNSGR